MRVEHRDVTHLAADLAAADRDVNKEARGVVAKGSLNIKNDARRRIQGLAHAPAYPRAITYDVTAAGDTITGEIGPDKSKRQGPLGNILEYGSINNAPIPHLGPALDAEAPRFTRALENLAVRLVEP